ncbi:hypothetical protein [Blastococcus atacamensis]|uniref:hypothetical protein n=1 Tax=Blastococcus atacamensis TaxID=2070508 RepID=UPI0013000371|nr:hypothetical protein [Blastococcus atacamensis]
MDADGGRGGPEVVAVLGSTPLLGCGWETNGHLADAFDPMDLGGVEPSLRRSHGARRLR